MSKNDNRSAYGMARMFAQIARDSLDESLVAVKAYLSGELATFRDDVAAAGIGLLMDADTVGRTQQERRGSCGGC